MDIQDQNVYIWEDSVLKTTNYELLPTAQNKLGTVHRIPSYDGEAEQRVKSLNEFLVQMGVNLIYVREMEMMRMRHQTRWCEQ